MDFVVYWIPTRTLNFNPFNFKKKYIREINIDDTGRWYIDILFIPILGKYGKIVIFDSNSLEDLVILEITDFTNGGFLLCKVEFCKPYIKNKLTNTLYHLIKEIWHSHEFHAPEEDTLLEAFLISANTSSLKFDFQLFERSILHFLKNYYLKFSTLSDKYSSYSPEKNFLSYLYEPLKFHLYPLYSKEVENLEKALGEYLYFSNLKTEAKLLNLKNNEIEKLITEIDNFKEFLTFKVEEFKHKKEIIVSGWTFIALVIGLFALFLTL